MKYLLTTYLLLLLSLQMFAQEIKKENLLEQHQQIIVGDTLDFSVAFTNYYDNISFLNHHYDYERINEINKLRKWSRDVEIAGYASFFAILFLNGYLVEKYDWSLWIDIPCTVVISCAVMYTFNKWSGNLKKRAEALEEHTAYFYHVGDKLDIGLAKYTSRYDSSYSGVGLGFKVLF